MENIICGFVGLGLIGGSIAKALRQKLPSCRIVAYDINPDTLEIAKNEKIADVITTSIDHNFSCCNYIFLCAPVLKNDENLQAVKQVISPDCLLTDVGSVKTDIHRAIEDAGLSHQFIGGHPMAGSERVGFVNSKALLLENAYYILTPTKDVTRKKLEHYTNLVALMGALPLVLTPQEHDFVTAAISHLPHVIAASLVNLVKSNDSTEGTMKMIAAGGFKDITRIASSSSAMWQQICLSNHTNISELLSSYIDSLKQIKSSIDTRDDTALYDFFDAARNYRDSFNNASSGPIKRSYILRIDIEDEPGALACIVALLAARGISIKNIGISHNREFEGGILRIELYDETSVEQAATLLTTRNYSVHLC